MSVGAITALVTAITAMLTAATALYHALSAKRAVGQQTASGPGNSTAAPSSSGQSRP